jgi:hypothetical protein
MFTSLQFTIHTLAHTIRCISEGKVGLNRLQEFLELPEYVQPSGSGSDIVVGGDGDCDSDGEEKEDVTAIKVTGANMAWRKPVKIGEGKDIVGLFLLPDATLSHMVKECRKLFSAFLCSKKRDKKSLCIDCGTFAN